MQWGKQSMNVKIEMEGQSEGVAMEVGETKWANQNWDCLGGHVQRRDAGYVGDEDTEDGTTVQEEKRNDRVCLTPKT